MKKTNSLKVRRYAARLIDLNEYLASFTRATIADKIGVTELNEIILNSMPNSRSKQAYVQVCDCESISFLKAVNMFERMEIAESIYEGVVAPSYKNNWAESNRTVLSRKNRVEYALSNTHPVTDGSTGNLR